MADFSSEKPERKVTITADDTRRIMREAIRDAAFPVQPGEPLKVWLGKLSRSLGIAFNRLYDIYAGETIPRWHEGETIRLRAEERRRLIARWEDIAAGHELAGLRKRLERIDGDGPTKIERRAVAEAATDDGRQPPLDLG